MTAPRICAWTLVALSCCSALAEDDYIAPQPLYDAGMVKYWQARLPLEKDQYLRDAYLVDDQLYLGTNDGYVYAVYAPTGTIRWMAPVTRSGYHVRRPCHAGGQTIVVTPTDIQTYDRQTGEGLLRTELRFPPGSDPVTDGQRLYIGGLDRRLYALDVATNFFVWRVVVDAAISSTPAIYGDLIVTAADNGSVYACTRTRKALRWQSAMYGAVEADPVTAEPGVYIACRDQSLYLLDYDFGQPRWRARFSGPLYEAPVYTPELTYQYCPDDGLAAVENVLTIDQRIRWRLREGRHLLTVVNQVAYIQTTGETIAVVGTKKGDVVHSIPAPGFTLAMPAPEASTLYIASPQGQVFCARPPGAPAVTKEEVISALQPLTTQKAEAATQPATKPTTQPATQPTTQPEITRPGLPIGGKSKVSRGYAPGRK